MRVTSQRATRHNTSHPGLFKDAVPSADPPIGGVAEPYGWIYMTTTLRLHISTFALPVTRITDTRKCCRLHIDKGLRLPSVFHNGGHRFVDLVKVIMQLSGDLRNTAAQTLKHNTNTNYNIYNSRIRARRAFSDKAGRRRLKQNRARNQISERKIIYILYTTL